MVGITMERQIKSRQRVADHGEVFTAEREVNAMLDLVKQETERIDSRFLEPACGDGNFLAEILRRKLKESYRKYHNIPIDYEKSAVLAISSIYGIDIMMDNVIHCQQRLFSVWNKGYKMVCKHQANDKTRELVLYILSRNIICGNTLTMKCADENGASTNEDIVFSKWLPATNSMMQRKDYTFAELQNDKCIFCNASEINLEASAMRFDVIIGNPPYQMSDGGGTGKSAKPIYQLFVDQAKRLKPRYLSMIIPSRWFSGGKGLDEFRKTMLTDRHIRTLVDYDNFKEVFPGVDLAGGACYFLWDRDHAGPCEVTNVSGGTQNTMVRELDEFDTFIRQNQALGIVRKVRRASSGRYLNEVVQSRNPFGIPSTYTPRETGVPCYYTQRIGKKYADWKDISDPAGLLDKWKFLVPKAPIAGQTDFSRPVGFYYDGNTRIAAPGECCAESWLVAGAFDTREEAEAYKSYIFTKVVRFLLLQTVVSQNISKKNYCFIPHLGSYAGVYTDEMLCRMWGITQEEWQFIDSKISAIGGEEGA